MDFYCNGCGKNLKNARRVFLNKTEIGPQGYLCSKCGVSIKRANEPSWFYVAILMITGILAVLFAILMGGYQ